MLLTCKLINPKVALVILLTCTFLGVQAQPQFDWAKAFSGASSVTGTAVATDNAGNVYITGGFFGTVDFDPGPGVFNLTATNTAQDIFLCKLSPSGTLLWAKKIGGTSQDLSFSIAVDPSGNAYVTGFYQGTVDFDPGIGIYNLSSVAAGKDIFILKLDATGGFSWAKALGNGSPDQGKSIAVDVSGNVYLTGGFIGAVDFDPGAGVYTIDSGSGNDLFILKLSTNGDFVWALSISTSSDGMALGVDPTGNIVITGTFLSAADFNPGSGTFFLQAAGGSQDYDVFVLKLDPSGNFIWAKRMGGMGYDGGYGISIDVNGNIYTVGKFTGTADFDPGAAIYNLTTAAFNNMYVSKLTAAGIFIWAKKIDNIEISEWFGNAVGVDGSGNVYGTGSFTGTSDFDPGAATFNLTSNGQRDICIFRLDAHGIFSWAKNLGSSNDDEAYGVAVTYGGGAYITGVFRGTVNFNPPGVYTITDSGGGDAFVVRYTVPPPTYSFVGNGNWSNPANWTNNLVPVSPIPSGTTIVIDPSAGGECIADIPVTFSSGSNLKINTGAVIKLPGNLILQ